MDDTKGLSLGKRQLLEFAFALIGFRLAVRRAGQLVVRVKGAGGPLVKTIARIRRAQKLHRADREQNEEQLMPGYTNHDALPPRESRHRNMSSTRSAIASKVHAAKHQHVTRNQFTIPCSS
jgi:hypothetical protein